MSKQIQKEQSEGSQRDMKAIDWYIQQYAVAGKDLKNVAVNFSIIKHNEQKSLNREGLNDIGVEELEFDVVDNLGRSQDQ